MNNSILDTFKYIKSELDTLYPKEEIESFIYLIFEYINGYSRVDIHTKAHTKLSNKSIIQIKEIITDLKNFKPIQYIFGSTEFYNLKLDLSPDVLIPRQETEELIRWILIDENTGSTKLRKSILDIGTGSGCIAISLAKNISGALVNAIDISSEALKIGIKNSLKNKVDVFFFKYNILESNYKPANFNILYDIIVSNPPYVCENEKKMMQKNVLDYEPHIALFVDDNNPLIFYKAIACFAINHLKNGGFLYFEINEKMAEKTKTMLENKGFENIFIKNDINNRNRMVRCTKTNA